MANALVTHVTLEGRDIAAAEQFLNDQVIPIVKQLPGFQRGVWLRSEDGSTGMGIVVFDSAENAESARQGMETMRPADAPPITGAEIYVVTGVA